VRPVRERKRCEKRKKGTFTLMTTSAVAGPKKGRGDDSKGSFHQKRPTSSWEKRRKETGSVDGRTLFSEGKKGREGKQKGSFLEH